MRPFLLNSGILAVLVACGRSGEGATSEALPRLALAEVASATTTQTAQQEATTRRVLWGERVDPVVSISPGGTLLAVTDWETGDLATFDLERKQQHRLTHQPSSYAQGMALNTVFSRDGRRIAYSWSEWEKVVGYQLRVIDVEGGEPRVLQSPLNPAWVQPHDWSPDGTRIVGVRMRDDGVHQIVLFSPDDTTAIVLRTLDWRGPEQMRFSPDGRLIAYDFPASAETEERDVFLLAVDGSREVRLVEHPADDMLMGWSPDGNSVVFLSDRSGTPGAWIVAVSGGRPAGAPRLIKADLWNTRAVGGTPDGRLFYVVQVDTRRLYIVTMTNDGAAVAGPPLELPTRALGEARSPSWSPDGRHLAFVREGLPTPAVNSQSIVVRSIESGEERSVRSDRRLAYVRRLLWMPDGQSFLVLATDEQNRQGVFRLDARTGRTETYVHGDFSDELAPVLDLSPDGRVLYYARRYPPNQETRTKDRVLARELASGKERVVFEVEGGQARFLTLSPDGRSLAFHYWRQPDRLTIAIANVADGSMTSEFRIGSNVRQLAWSRDGAAIFFTLATEDAANALGDRATRLRRIDIASGQISDAGLAMDQLGTYSGLSFHPDGRRLAVIAGRTSHELWTLDAFGGGRTSRTPAARN